MFKPVRLRSAQSDSVLFSSAIVLNLVLISFIGTCLVDVANGSSKTTYMPAQLGSVQFGSVQLSPVQSNSGLCVHVSVFISLFGQLTDQIKRAI